MLLPRGRRWTESKAEDALRIDGLSVNVDLIAGLPGEDLARWPESVATVASLGPGHVSVYLLETDAETPLARSIRCGRTPAADEQQVVAAYHGTVEVLAGFGIEQYCSKGVDHPNMVSRPLLFECLPITFQNIFVVVRNEYPNALFVMLRIHFSNLRGLMAAECEILRRGRSPYSQP